MSIYMTYLLIILDVFRLYPTSDKMNKLDRAQEDMVACFSQEHQCKSAAEL